MVLSRFAMQANSDKEGTAVAVSPVDFAITHEMQKKSRSYTEGRHMFIQLLM